MRLNRNGRQEIRVGCSGWQYKHWRGGFYPAGLPQSRWFAHYALAFDTVEINNSFYRLPSAETFAVWREQAPSRFLYAVKASRFLTHMKKLVDPDEPLLRFFANVRQLGSRLGPILYQLPPNLVMNLERLETFLKAIHRSGRTAALPPLIHHVIEFRNPLWYDDRVYDLLHRYRVALCLHDMQGSATGKLAVGPCIYVRFHFGTVKYGGDMRTDASMTGPTGSRRRPPAGATCSRTSTTTPAAMRRRTPFACANACTAGWSTRRRDRAPRFTWERKISAATILPVESACAWPRRISRSPGRSRNSGSSSSSSPRTLTLSSIR